VTSVPLILLLWAAWGAYWLIAARRVKPARRRESLGSRLAHLVPLTLAGVLFAIPTIPGRLGVRWWPAGPAPYWAGVGLVVLGLGFTVWARVVLGGNWSAMVTVKQSHEIVRAGPYRAIRHPIYTGLIVAVVGCAIARGDGRGVLALAMVVLVLWRKLRLEERWMTEEFGEQYEAYRRNTWALIPFVL
jgi:protein-S-isoprenylcysteine O-methyltransferase Ste14